MIECLHQPFGTLPQYVQIFCEPLSLHRLHLHRFSIHEQLSDSGCDVGEFKSMGQMNHDVILVAATLASRIRWGLIHTQRIRAVSHSYLPEAEKVMKTRENNTVNAEVVSGTQTAPSVCRYFSTAPLPWHEIARGSIGVLF